MHAYRIRHPAEVQYSKSADPGSEVLGANQYRIYAVRSISLVSRSVASRIHDTSRTLFTRCTGKGLTDLDRLVPWADVSDSSDSLARSMSFFLLISNVASSLWPGYVQEYQAP